MAGLFLHAFVALLASTLALAAQDSPPRPDMT